MLNTGNYVFSIAEILLKTLKSLQAKNHSASACRLSGFSFGTQKMQPAF